MIRFINLTAWLGTLCLCLAPFIIDTIEGKFLAMLGLALLCLQAAHKSC